jgi:hypothetical protein
VPIHFKPLLGIVTRKDFYFYFIFLVTVTVTVIIVIITVIIVIYSVYIKYYSKQGEKIVVLTGKNTNVEIL